MKHFCKKGNSTRCTYCEFLTDWYGHAESHNQPHDLLFGVPAHGLRNTSCKVEVPPVINCD